MRTPRTPWIFILGSAIALVFFTSACGRKEAAPSPPPPEAATADTPPETAPAAADPNATPATGTMPAPSKDGLTRLCSDQNAYIRNNAKQALESWDAGEYAAAVIALQKVMSLCKTASQQEDALSSLAQLKQEIDAAAAKGNAIAREAAAQLGR
jgi:hypothetical protein